MKWFKLNKIGSIVTALGMESIVRLYYLLSDVKNTLINCVPTVKRSVGSRQYSKTECQSVIDDPFIGKSPATVCLVTIMPFRSSPVQPPSERASVFGLSCSICRQRSCSYISLVLSLSSLHFSSVPFPDLHPTFFHRLSPVQKEIRT